MDIQALKELINKNTKDGLTELRKQTAKDKNVEKWTNEFKGDHAILKDPNKRDITVGEGTQSRVVKKARQIVKYQKKITNTAISFLLGASPDLILRNVGEKEEAGFQFILDLWKDAKLDYFSRELMRTVCIETEAAELWYTRETQNGYKIRPMLISEGQGYEFGPYFDDMGDMIAFWYMPKTGDKVKTLYVYFPDSLVKAIYKNSQWTSESSVNPYGKIPIVYYKQDEPEWQDVQTQIDRIEYMISGMSDTNDYFFGPVLKLWGELLNAPEKGESGKMLQFDKMIDEESGKEMKSDAEYLTWDHSPASFELEYQTLTELIYNLTNTPDVSFEKVKGIGSLSGVAIQLMFLDPIIKKKNKEEMYGEAFQRRLSVMQSLLMIANKDARATGVMGSLNIDIVFNSILPTAVTEVIEALNIATGGKASMSQKRAIRLNPMNENPTEEEDQIEKESQEESQKELGIGQYAGTFRPEPGAEKEGKTGEESNAG